MNDKIEKIFGAESDNYASKHKLNTCNKAVSQEMLNKIEAGCSLEALEEIAQGFDIFKYRTQITVHGLFPELSTNCIGRYVNIMQNKNKSVGIKYTAIDHAKKMKLYRLICDCTDYRIFENSSEFKIHHWEALDTSSEEAFKAPIKKAVDEIKKIDRSLFFGSVQVYVSRGLFRTYLVKEINIRCFYEKNSKQIAEQICGMNYDEILTKHHQKVEQERQRELEWERKCEANRIEAEQKEKLLKSRLEEFKRTTPPPQGFLIAENRTLKAGDIVARPLIGKDEQPAWFFYKMSKSFGRLIIKRCNENGEYLDDAKGRELLKRQYTGYIKIGK